MMKIIIQFFYYETNGFTADDQLSNITLKIIKQKLKYLIQLTLNMY